MRDHRNLDVFRLADELTMAFYEATHDFPMEERFGITSQIRRASVSVLCNIVEGCARRSEADFANFLRIAFGSLREVGYLIDLAHKLRYFDHATRDELHDQFDQCARNLAGLINSMER